MDAGGAIIDNNGDATNVITEVLNMTAVNGIGTLMDPIETQVQILTAQKYGRQRYCDYK